MSERLAHAGFRSFPRLRAHLVGRSGVPAMSIDEFWSLVGSADKDTIIRALSRLSQQDIIDFEFLLRERIIECDYYDLIAALKIICGGVSDDSYLYFRCWLIGKGRRILRFAIPTAAVGEPPDRAADKVRVCRQLQSRQGTRNHGTTHTSRPRRRSDRIGRCL